MIMSFPISSLPQEPALPPFLSHKIEIEGKKIEKNAYRDGQYQATSQEAEHYVGKFCKEHLGCLDEACVLQLVKHETDLVPGNAERGQPGADPPCKIVLNGNGYRVAHYPVGYYRCHDIALEQGTKKQRQACVKRYGWCKPYECPDPHTPGEDERIALKPFESDPVVSQGAFGPRFLGFSILIVHGIHT